jgi:hypothetical protein
MARAATYFVDVPDLADYDRVALAWQGDLGVELHVRWKLALPGCRKAMSARTPRATRHVRPKRAGFLTLLGDAGDLAAPMLAQVYTMPRQWARVHRAVHRRARHGRQLHPDRRGAPSSRRRGGRRVVPLGFTYPTCDAVGDTLVLQNVFDDLRLAAN